MRDTTKSMNSWSHQDMDLHFSCCPNCVRAQVFRNAPDPHFPAVGGPRDDVNSNPAHPDRHRVVTIQSQFAPTAPLEIVIEQTDPFAIAASVEIDGATQTAASLVSVRTGDLTATSP
jgi:hypothetical protein